MTQEELLKPRYKVVALYPHCIYKIGDILIKYVFDNGNYGYTTNHEIPLQGHVGRRDDIENYPHLFKKLEWWEERSPKDFPEYLKIEKGDDNFFPSQWGRVFKVNRWSSGYAYSNNDRCFDNRKWAYKPATEEEYKQYISIRDHKNS